MQAKYVKNTIRTYIYTADTYSAVEHYDFNTDLFFKKLGENKFTKASKL